MDTGTYFTTNLKAVRYGPSSISTLPSLLKDLLTPAFPQPGETEPKSPTIKCMIITGKSLTTKTPLVKDLEGLLMKEGMYGCTFSDIAQHAPIKDIRRAQQIVAEQGITVLVSLGGGSPIDSAKAIAYYIRESTGAQTFMPHVAIPTTLSVAETTSNAGHTSETGQKIGVSHPLNSPLAIIYDPLLTLHTPQRLLLSTGIRALDHAIEVQYREGATKATRDLGKAAVKGLFEGLRAVKNEREGEKKVEVRTGLMLSGWESLWPAGRVGALGLSHSIGHRIGASYAIPHGICSCLTLGPTVRLMAITLKGQDLLSLAEVAPYIPTYDTTPGPTHELNSEADQRKACEYVADQIDLLVRDLGLKSTLAEYKVEKDEIEKVASFVMERAPKGDEGKYTEVQIKEEILERIYT